MEIILVATAALTLILLVVLVGTRGKPLTLVYQFKSVVREIIDHVNTIANNIRSSSKRK